VTAPPAGVQSGRHAVVTGGGRGIGAAIASALAGEGAALTLMGRTAASLEAHAEHLRRTHGVRAVALAMDVGDPAAVRQAFADAVAQLGPVHVLVNNAGQAVAGAVQDLALDQWQRVLAVNLTGALLCIQQVLPAMLAARSGRIVNVASTAGLTGYARVAAYCVSKHGLVGLTRALAAETAKDGVTVNAVCPSYVDDTDMTRGAIENVSRATGRSAEEARAVLARRSPRGDLVTPAEVAATVAWLCSPGASAITGQAVAVAAGELMR
jgi:NAD(P)-dependent dehydrogenase (short-subunit alcohol dehydrogenase family)